MRLRPIGAFAVSAEVMGATDVWSASTSANRLLRRLRRAGVVHVGGAWLLRVQPTVLTHRCISAQEAALT